MPEIFALSAKPQGRLSSTAIASKKPPFERGSLLRTDRDDAIKYLTKLGPKPTENNSNLHRYIKWFGRYNDERYRSVYTLFSAMKSHPLDSTEFTCATFMQCKKNTSFLRAFTLVAFVITPDIGKINLCSNFWKESDEAQVRVAAHLPSNFTQMHCPLVFRRRELCSMRRRTSAMSSPKPVPPVKRIMCTGLRRAKSWPRSQ
ncbi:hypothetical protein HGRIS_010279 [Hohenbuehelia grisea]|uniref:Lysine-specific metallo-endopeptidase domain-containing protein n=1 Tax=Hohenbuehelia grisea TaxID=104357 RepID=A0ABR3J3U2_9AGAR